MTVSDKIRDLDARLCRTFGADSETVRDWREIVGLRAVSQYPGDGIPRSSPAASRRPAPIA